MTGLGSGRRCDLVCKPGRRFASVAAASSPKQSLFHHEEHEAQEDFELGNQEPRNGISKIEIEGAMGSAERVGDERVLDEKRRHTLSCVPN